MAQKRSAKGTKLRREKNHRNEYESITDGDRIHRKRQLVLKHPNKRERNHYYIDELNKIETSLQKREKIKKARVKRHDFLFY